MTREIKFRGWNKKSKMMVDNIQVYSPRDTLSLNSCFDPDMIVLPLQYTGLKDKNGKEIYEGDILEPVMINGSITLGKVYFDLGSYMVQQIGAEGMADELVNTIRNSEVIGNIMENPELVK